VTNLLEGKVTLVTGGASGIGEAVALTVAGGGAKVAVVDLDAAMGQDVVNRIKAKGTDAIFVKCDVSKSGDVEKMIGTVLDRFGRLDCAVNNAGIIVMAPTAELSEEDWDRMIAIDLKGVWLCMKYEIQQMLKLGGGAIVNIASVAGYIGTPGMCAYTASKHGVVGLTKTAALEYVKAGIRVNAVCPGAIDTPILAPLDEATQESLKQMHPIGRFGKPEEIAAAVLWLCSDAASFCTGIAMPVDGGLLAQ
jgi:NAD(P)-dependent dehydrogenase (short-subunit alcohol dehydrogenase family)